MDISLLFACQVRYARRRSREATHFCSLKLKREIKDRREVSSGNRNLRVALDDRHSTHAFRENNHVKNWTEVALRWKVGRKGHEGRPNSIPAANPVGLQINIIHFTSVWSELQN